MSEAKTSKELEQEYTRLIKVSSDADTATPHAITTLPSMF